ncbi:ExbD/TolR family protein [Rhodopirellula bahusiensis]|uniref:Biopolymer transporter ExbD n=1 Tax=Rhodopirellula bahusiensis TaxID=2014065 RepID=A0A2G1W554_9BACT|nr:biopolymer transporter ExbD [Rhodopirellula bahusiensis]PHQ34174.1 biopolymer transporter ExbD [Rhodopirellula bahusiensis]
MNERLGGRKIRCPGCDSPITIPEAPAVVDAEPIEAEPVEVEAVEVEAIAAEPVVEPVMSAEPELAGVGSPAHAAMRDGLAAVSEGVEPAAFNLDDDDDALPPRKKRDDGELDMTPMVDVTFLLLIFFMVTASFSLQKSIQMPRQQSELPSSNPDPDPTDEKDPVELEIDENGGFLVLAAEWEKETPGKQNLISALKEAVGDNRDGMQLNIKIHENAKLQFLVDGMDAGTIAGFAALQVTEVDGFD